MAENFSKLTFEYFELARKNRKNGAWFEKNKNLYLDHVKAPFANLIELLDMHVGPRLPDIAIAKRKIKRPIYSKNRPQPDGSVVRPQTSAYFAQKQNTRFEWNPGIYLEFGNEETPGMVGIGLYEPSGRQRTRLREAIVNDYDAIKGILSSRKVKAWGGIGGERYIRFPRGYEEGSRAAPLLWHKEFFLSRKFTKAEIIKKDFIPKLVMELEAAAPFLIWIRDSVGTYDGRYQFGKRPGQELA
ncbi:MAG: DUF2461 family protein, partial [Proteobacteria bacterium]